MNKKQLNKFFISSANVFVNMLLPDLLNNFNIDISSEQEQPSIIKFSRRKLKRGVNKLYLTKQKVVKLIPLKKGLKPSGIIRPFPAAAIEWHNSSYSYNSNYNKLLTIADNKFLAIVKSYLVLKKKEYKEEKF